jgi:hypothetical protein
MREAKVNENFAGERMKSEPSNQASVRFRSDAMVKMPELIENIPQSWAKNQMKSTRGRSLYHKVPYHFDLSA